MARVDELKKKYPSIPRELLVKVECVTSGIRDTDLLYTLGHWHRSGGTTTYQTYDHDTSLKEAADKRPTVAAREGYVKRLDSFYMKGGWGVRIERNSKSPYEIRETGSGKYGLFEGEEMVQNVYFPGDLKPWPYITREEPLTSTGKPITTVVNLRSPNCAGVTPVRHCEYFATGEQCKFCNYNPTQEDARSVGAMRAVTAPLNEVLEAYKILASEVRLIETTFVSGGFTDRDRELKIYADFIGKMAGATSYRPSLNLCVQPPKSRRDLQRLKDSGVDVFSVNPEVWDPELFAKIVPGKARCIGLERYKEAMIEAVDIFGAGDVHATLVSGATVMPEYGHKTWQESRDVLIDGVQWMAKNGVAPVFIQQRWAPGSDFAKDPSSRDRIPPVEHHLDLLMAVDAAMKENGLYEKMSRIGRCLMCCGDNIFAHDLGVFELSGGNAGNWMAPVIPDEINWLARIAEWIEEAESGGRTRP